MMISLTVRLTPQAMSLGAVKWALSCVCVRVRFDQPFATIILLLLRIHIHSKSNPKWFFFHFLGFTSSSRHVPIQFKFPWQLAKSTEIENEKQREPKEKNEIYDLIVDTIGKGQKRRKETKEFLLWNVCLLAGRAKRKLNVGVHSWMKRTQLVEHTHNVTMHKILQRRRDGGERRVNGRKWTRTQTRTRIRSLVLTTTTLVHGIGPESLATTTLKRQLNQIINDNRN